MSNWYALRIISRQERSILESMDELGFETYLPCETVWAKAKRGKEPERVQVPLLVGYLFAKLTEEQMFWIQDVDGVIGFVTNQGRPCKVSQADLMWLAWFEGTGEYDATWMAQRERWKPKKGDAVKIASGAYAGKSGTVDKLRGKNRAMIVMSLFGMGAKPYDIPIADLEAA